MVEGTELVDTGYKCEISEVELRLNMLKAPGKGMFSNILPFAEVSTIVDSQFQPLSEMNLENLD